ncbi:MAG: glycogen/starch synthase [Patescibacteria group bacterium]
MPRKLKIVHIASEVAPFSKTGGLGSVARSLPKALSRLGQEVIIITPLYGRLIDKQAHKLELLFPNISLRLNSQEKIRVNYWRGYLLPDLPVYFVEYKKFFSKHRRLYGSTRENARFLVFNVAALKLLSLLKFSADIIQCHDWQAGLIPYYLKTDFRYSKTLKQARTIFTIHNLSFQFGHDWWTVAPKNKDYGRGKLPHLDDPKLEYINFAKRGILAADFINTVSEQYRDEIMTKKFGQNLHRILQHRADRLTGIINGIDYNLYNPEQDRAIHQRYSFKDPAAKLSNKAYLQKLFKLPLRPEAPVFCMTSRVTFQKGFGLIIATLPRLLELDAQFIIIGAGDRQYIKELQKIARRHPQKLAVIPSHEANQKYETQVYAGADFFLLTSNHEPCGINQLIAMRYGCVPIVRATGGLHDTVENFSLLRRHSTGFTFKHEDPADLQAAINRALKVYSRRKIWASLVKQVMQQSNGWEIPAKKYLALYRKVLKDKR